VHVDDDVVVVVVRVVVVVVVAVVVDVIGRDVVVDVTGWDVVVVVPPPTEPVQVFPLSAKLAGTGLEVLFQEPLKPKLADPPVERDAFQPASFTDTFAPDWVTVPFQSGVPVWPAPNDQVRVQPLIASPRLTTLTLAPKPPGHWLETE
jgi:hypothetical protein